jgi:chromate transporter
MADGGDNASVEQPTAPEVPSRGSLSELAAIFLRLGLTAFGGPAAHLAMMRQEFVERRKWVTDEEFVDLMAAANLVPGPNSTEVAIHIGLRRAGWPGLVVAGACFILPAAILVSLIAAAYVRYGTLPDVRAVLYGIKPVVVAIVVQAIWGLARSVLRTWLLAATAAVALGLALLGAHELAVLFGAGVVFGGARAAQRRSLAEVRPLALLALAIGAVALFPVAVNAALPVGATGPLAIFLSFLKIGSVLYGSGYVLLAFLQSEMVVRHHWLTSSQLLDATAVGQFTPGPLFTTSTFIGYLLFGPWGAVVATIGIFLPAFLFVAISGPLIPQLRKSATTSAFLDGVNAASLALMAAVTVTLARDALVDPLTVGLALVAGAVLVWLKPNSAWVVLGGGLAGWVASQLR